MSKPGRILMFVGWKVKKCNDIPTDLQPPDYDCKGKLYWFFRHLPGEEIEVDVVDNSCALGLWELFEKKTLHLYLWQGLRKLRRLKNYDLIISHGAQSAVVLAFLRSLIGVRFPPHIIIDIGSLNGGRKKKGELALFRLAMKSVDGIIYHVKQQKLHYQKYFPDIVKKSRFVPFGPDLDLFSINKCEPNEDYLLSIGYAKRDWKTLISAYERLSSPKPGLRILGDSRPICGSLPKGVNATGKVSFIDMKGQIAGARFIVIPLPSPRYAVGQMTVLQSMAMGKAVIVSRVPSMIDYVTDYHDALFYTPADVNDLRDKMELLIRNPGMAKGIGYNARITIERKFNEPVMAKQIWEAISEMAVVPVPREK